MSTCKARRVNDQMHCGPCGLQWDMNDEDRPDCNRPEKPNPRGGQHYTAAEIKRVASEAPKPTYAEVERRDGQARRDELIKMRRLLGLVVPGDILKQRHGHDTFTAVGHQTNSGEVLVSAPNREKSFFIRVEMVHNLTRLENEKT